VLRQATSQAAHLEHIADRSCAISENIVVTEVNTACSVWGLPACSGFSFMCSARLKCFADDSGASSSTKQAISLENKLSFVSVQFV